MRALTTTIPTPPALPVDRRASRTPAPRVLAASGRDAFRRCWCAERRGTPLPGCRDCGGGGMALVRFPVPRS